MFTLSDRLDRCGRELLGHGDAALVWGRPGDQWVVKVGFDGDDAWPAWAAWCQTNPGPHVPRIFSCQVFEHQGRSEGFVGILERLDRTRAAHAWLDGDRSMKRDPLRLAAVLEDDHPPLAVLLRSASASFPGAKWDMAPSNWMARSDGTLVLTDPIARLGTLEGLVNSSVLSHSA